MRLFRYKIEYFRLMPKQEGCVSQSVSDKSEPVRRIALFLVSHIFGGSIRTIQMIFLFLFHCLLFVNLLQLVVWFLAQEHL